MRCILFVNGDEFEVHFVSRGEHVGGALDDGLPRFRHRDGCAPGQENGLVPGAEGQGAGVTPLHEDHLKWSQVSFRAIFVRKFAESLSIGTQESLRIYCYSCHMFYNIGEATVIS